MSRQEELLLVGKRIAHARADRQATQKALAKHLGVSWEMVSRYERGISNPLPHIFAIAEFLHKPVEYFVQTNPLVTNADSPLQVADAIAPTAFDKLFAPLFNSYSEYQQWIQTGVFTGVYQIPLWMLKYGSIWVVNLAHCRVATPLVQTNGMLFMSQEQPSSAQSVVVVPEGAQFLVTTAKPQVTPLGYALAWEKRLV